MSTSSVASRFGLTGEKPRRTLEIVLAASLAIIAIAWGFEIFGKYRPCPLCLVQRYAYYFAIGASCYGLASIGLGLGSHWLRITLALIAIGYLINTGLGLQHSGVEWKWWAGPDTCSAVLPNLSAAGRLDLSQPVIRCDAAPWRFAYLSFAGWNAVLSFGLAILAGMGARRRHGGLV